MKNQFNVQANVHMKLSKGYRIKAHIGTLGVYINGIVVFPPDAKSDKWEFRSPAQKSGARWTSVIEFDKSYPLWGELVEACIQAAKEYHDTTTSGDSYIAPSGDVVLTDISDSPIDLSTIPF